MASDDLIRLKEYTELGSNTWERTVKNTTSNSRFCIQERGRNNAKINTREKPRKKKQTSLRQDAFVKLLAIRGNDLGDSYTFHGKILYIDLYTNFARPENPRLLSHGVAMQRSPYKWINAWAHVKQ